ncbi:hypothetical protein EMCG_07812 [[Emmonsia] crescens]|uniref:Uncharacterized protein n=1 Tax=[Emmonsia] crescens TaxID=73230 RepID=A0A0G2I792_9EURO|nr:hypothetical protein EMCG_07812 [Emmonsia crescens UAMH 3008]
MPPTPSSPPPNYWRCMNHDHPSTSRARLRTSSLLISFPPQALPPPLSLPGAKMKRSGKEILR